jgi:hypothetical protein
MGLEELEGADIFPQSLFHPYEAIFPEALTRAKQKLVYGLELPEL